MEISSRHDYAQIRAQAETFYRSVGKVFCPALNAEVYFSAQGFHHLRYDGNNYEREKDVQKTKMLCLKEAVEIINKSTTIQEFRTKTHQIGKEGTTRIVSYYALHAITDIKKRRRLKIVIRQIGEGNVHFWSVMPSWKDRGVERIIGENWMFDE